MVVNTPSISLRHYFLEGGWHRWVPLDSHDLYLYFQPVTHSVDIAAVKSHTSRCLVTQVIDLSEEAMDATLMDTSDRQREGVSWFEMKSCMTTVHDRHCEKGPWKGNNYNQWKEKYTLQLFVYGSRRIVIELDIMNLIYMSYSQVGLNDTFGC